MKYLLDTNVCIHWLHGKGGVADAINSHGLQNCCISEITKAELLYGEALAASKGYKINHDLLQLLFRHLRIIPISYCLELYAEEKARLRNLGTPIEDYDLLIGTSAVAMGMTLVSEDDKHMGRISGIRIENWVTRE